MTPADGWPHRGRWWLPVGQAACLATIAAAGRASAERPSTGGQAVWLAVAVAAAVISAAGNGAWLGTVRRVTNTRRRLVAARLAVPGPGADQPSSAGTGPVDSPRPETDGGLVDSPRPGSDGGPVMVPGLTLRHRPGCALVAGRAVVAATADTRPCGWCSP